MWNRLNDRAGDRGGARGIYYERLARLPRRARRALQRKWRRPLAAIALLLALGQIPALAATLPVAPGVAPDIVLDGACSLIEAIENANADAQMHADCPAGNGADTVVLPASSTQTLTQIHNEDDLGANGLPVITSSRITIEGNDSTIMRAGAAPEFRIFAVNGTANLTLNETTVSGGKSANNGGGIFGVNGAEITVTNSIVSGNSAAFGGGLDNDYRGTMTLTNSTVSGNSARFSGGGVGNLGTLLTLTNSTVSGNSVPFAGGGLSALVLRPSPTALSPGISPTRAAAWITPPA